MTGGRGASLDVPHGLAENPPCSACVSRSLAQVEPWDEIVPMAESRGGTPRGERAALCARRTRKVRGWIRVCRRSASLLFFFRTTWLKAQIVRIPAATAGVLWRRSGRRAKKFSSRDDDS